MLRRRSRSASFTFFPNPSTEHARPSAHFASSTTLFLALVIVLFVRCPCHGDYKFAQTHYAFSVGRSSQYHHDLAQHYQSVTSARQRPLHSGADLAEQSYTRASYP